MATISLIVNDQTHVVEIDPATPLLYVLRNDLGLKGAKYGCGLEQCGACKVLVDGMPAYSCNTPVEAFQGKRITTVEGIGTRADLHPIQQAFIAERAAQCGYCTPGMIVAAKALLDAQPAPDTEAIRSALENHLCRCGAYPRIVKAIKRAAEELRS